MATSTVARRANTTLDLTNKTAVIAGGSQGIGAATALRFASAGANIIIIGRSTARLQSVIDSAKKVAKSPSQSLSYISADLSLVSETKRVAAEITAKSQGSVDYLVQTQGGTPNGSVTNKTSEGIESHFALQTLSRFLLAHLLASTSVLKNTAISILAPGGTQTSFDLSDIELQSQAAGNRFANIGKAADRDGLIGDAYTLALQSRYPSIKFLHIFPGLVQTGVMSNQGVPWLIQILVEWIVYPIAARTFGNTPTTYAEIPVFLAANPEREVLLEREGQFLDNKNKGVGLAPWARDADNQQKVWETLLGYAEGR